MDIFSFIHHADPTKVKVGEMEKAGDQVSLLEATRGRIVPLAPLVPVTAASSEGNLTESIEKMFNEGNGAEKEHSIEGCKYDALTKAIVEPVNKDVAEKPMRLKKTRKVARDASNSSKLAAEIRVTAATTVPLVTSSESLMLEREGGDHTDSVSGPNLQTKPAVVRFVISSDSSHHSGTHSLDVKVFSLVRSTVPDPPVMTAAVTTTAVVETSLVSVSKVTVKHVNPTLFGDSMSTSGHDVARPSSPVHPELSADSFYAIHYLNPKTLHRVYVPKWTVTNEFVLIDPYMCRTLTDQLALPALFSQLLSMEYDQLYTEFNVREARMTCLGAEVRMRAEHTLRKKKILEEECAKKTNLLKEKDAEIASLKSQLSLKEAEAAEAIHPRGPVATVEATKSLHVAELNLLKDINSTLEAKMCLQSPEYLSVLGKAIGRAVDKGMQDGLVAGIEHGKAKRALSDVSAYNPFADVIYVAAVSAVRDVDFSLLTLLASQKDDSIADIMDSLCLEGPRIRIDAEARRLSLSGTRVPLIEPLSSKNLLGEASTFGVPVTADVVTTLSTTFAGSVSVSVPPLSVADYGVVHVGPQVEDPSSGGIVFEKEEMETSPKPVAGS
nr:hypothetical protein [Tanacetum cinerariifolium]